MPPRAGTGNAYFALRGLRADMVSYALAGCAILAVRTAIAVGDRNLVPLPRRALERVEPAPVPAVQPVR